MSGTDQSEARASSNQLLLDAVLTPHRSLSRSGFVILMAGLSALSFIAGVSFLLAGAWPVFGFFGLEVLLVYMAFRMSYRSGHQMETVQLSRDRLVVRRISPSGAVEAWTFQPYWLSVDIGEPDEHRSQLRLRSHGRSLTIGAFLSPAERGNFASALSEALRRCRCLPAPQA